MGQYSKTIELSQGEGFTFAANLDNLTPNNRFRPLGFTLDADFPAVVHNNHN